MNLILVSYETKIVKVTIKPCSLAHPKFSKRLKVVTHKKELWPNSNLHNGTPELRPSKWSHFWDGLTSEVVFFLMWSYFGVSLYHT